MSDDWDEEKEIEEHISDLPRLWAQWKLVHGENGVTYSILCQFLCCNAAILMAFNEFPKDSITQMCVAMGRMYIKVRKYLEEKDVENE